MKNLSIFPMQELSNPKNFNETLNFKMSNMNMNIKIQYSKYNKKYPLSYWIDKKKWIVIFCHHLLKKFFNI